MTGIQLKTRVRLEIILYLLRFINKVISNSDVPGLKLHGVQYDISGNKHQGLFHQAGKVVPNISYTIL